MSRDYLDPSDDAHYIGNRIEEVQAELEHLNRILTVYLKFAVGVGVRAIKAAAGDTPLPPEYAEIIKDMEALDLG